jgi:hypothetical protein
MSANTINLTIEDVSVTTQLIIEDISSQSQVVIKTDEPEPFTLQVFSGLVGGPGAQGNTGVDGLSAYEIAVQNGFVGTEQEWLQSLQPDLTAESIGTALGYDPATPASVTDVRDDLDAHIAAVDPHPQYTSASELSTAIGTVNASIGTIQSDLSDHIADTLNPHSVTKAQIGLGNVDDTSDANKPVSTAQAAADSVVASGAASALASHVAAADPHPGYVLESTIGVAGGITPLGIDGKIDESYLPVSVLGQVEYQGTWAANSGSAPTATPQKGWYYIVTTGGSYNLDGITDWVVGDWAIYNGTAWNKVDNTDAVSSVAGLGGVITDSALKSALALDLVTNTADADKPVSTAQAAAIAAVQADIDAHESNVSNPHGVTKTQIGLGNVDNTSDANKPVSTAQAAADTAVQSYAIQRGNHTGTQALSTISQSGATLGQAPIWDGGAWVPGDIASGTPIRRYSQSGNYQYCGFAAAGSDEAASVWTIRRLTYSSGTYVITESATSVSWTGRSGHTYT